jgi:hypothetical protein
MVKIANDMNVGTKGKDRIKLLRQVRFQANIYLPKEESDAAYIKFCKRVEEIIKPPEQGH